MSYGAETRHLIQVVGWNCVCGCLNLGSKFIYYCIEMLVGHISGANEMLLLFLHVGECPLNPEIFCVIYCDEQLLKHVVGCLILSLFSIKIWIRNSENSASLKFFDHAVL